MAGSGAQYRNEGQTFWLGKRRRLGYAEYGVADGPAVLYCHGWPSSRLEASILAASAAAEGVRLLSVDRPGLGLSDAIDGYTLRRWAEDVRELAAGLQLTQLAVMGVSSGGPFAFACARYIPELLVAAGTVGGVGPPASQRFIYRGERLLLRLAQRTRRGAQMLVQQAMRPLSHNPQRVWQQFERSISPADVPVFKEPAVRDAFLGAMQEAVRQGTHALVTDMLHYSQAWDFTLAEIKLPFYVFHGAQDTLVSPAAARYLAARLHTAQLQIVPGEGHLSILINHGAQILRALIGTHGFQKAVDAR